MTSFRVAEHFASINGEGVRAGEAAVFIRFCRCNLRCSYCDTQWANDSDAPFDLLSCEELLKIVQDSGISDVTLTGGEPMLQPGLEILTDALIGDGHRVEIETNGSISISGLSQRRLRPAFTLDYKLPSSGMESHMLTDNYKYLRECDTVKFVCGGAEDLERAREIISAYSLTDKCHVYLSPVFGKADPQEMVSFMLRNRMNDVRLQLQLHKYIWSPDQRGV